MKAIVGNGLPSEEASWYLGNPWMCEKKNYSLQLFYFGHNTFETARANATIRKDSGFAMDFAPHDIKIDAEVAEIAQFLCSLAPAKTD